MNVRNEKVVVIGGSSGIGLAIAQKSIEEGYEVVISGRSKKRLDEAVNLLGKDNVTAFVVDISSKENVVQLFSQVKELNHLIITAAQVPYGPLEELEEDIILNSFKSRLLGPIFAAQASKERFREGGTITLISGVSAQRPVSGGAIAALQNGAINGLTKALAVELRPIRVNAVAPGWMDTPFWDTVTWMTPEKKAESYAKLTEKLPVSRVGEAEDIAQAVSLLLKNSFMCGTTVQVDGGHPLV